MSRISEAAIVDAAFNLAEAGGPEGVTMQALAAMLGVKAPSLYAHVRSLDDVKEAVAERGAHALREGEIAAYTVEWHEHLPWMHARVHLLR